MTDATSNTVIWSDEHRAYWRPEGSGYTDDVESAGLWPYAKAERLTRHCGPEKGIRLLLKHEVPAAIAAKRRREAAAVVLWHRFAPGRRTWAGEPRKDEYRLAVDAVMEAMNVR